MISSFSFIFAQLPGAGVGFIVGAFTPSVGRKIKSFFVKNTKEATVAIDKGVSQIEKKF